MREIGRTRRLQIMLTDEEVAALDDYRFDTRLPSRSEAVRELLRAGLATQQSKAATKSSS